MYLCIHSFFFQQYCSSVANVKTEQCQMADQHNDDCVGNMQTYNLGNTNKVKVCLVFACQNEDLSHFLIELVSERCSTTHNMCSWHISQQNGFKFSLALLLTSQETVTELPIRPLKWTLLLWSFLTAEATSSSDGLILLHNEHFATQS